jgi:hypothetical protein
MQVSLAEDDGSCVLEGGYARSVFSWLRVRQSQIAASSWHVCRIIVVFEQYRNTEERSSSIASQQLLVQVVGNSKSIGIQGDDSVGSVVVGFDVGEE